MLATTTTKLKPMPFPSGTARLFQPSLALSHYRGCWTGAMSPVTIDHILWPRTVDGTPLPTSTVGLSRCPAMSPTMALGFHRRIRVPF